MLKNRPNETIIRSCPKCDSPVTFKISDVRKDDQWRGKCLKCGQSCTLKESGDPDSSSPSSSHG